MCDKTSTSWKSLLRNGHATGLSLRSVVLCACERLFRSPAFRRFPLSPGLQRRGRVRASNRVCLRPVRSTFTAANDFVECCSSALRFAKTPAVSSDHEIKARSFQRVPQTRRASGTSSREADGWHIPENVFESCVRSRKAECARPRVQGFPQTMLTSNCETFLGVSCCGRGRPHSTCRTNSSVGENELRGVGIADRWFSENGNNLRGCGLGFGC